MVGARHRLDPGRGDPDDRLRERLVVVADALELGARRGPVRTLEERAGVVLGIELGVVGRRAHGPDPSDGVGPVQSAGPTGVAPRGALQALALPAAEPPDVALEHLRVDLAAREVHVGLGDQAALVALEGHPLGEHVVGVGQPRRAVGARLVRELDAVLVQQPAGLRQVGHDRAVRVDQVRVRRAAQVARDHRVAAGPGLPAPHADEAEVAVHRPLLVVDARLQQLAGALLGAALAAGVVARQALALGDARAVGLADLQLAGGPRVQDLPQQREDDDGGGGQCGGQRAALPSRARPRRPRRAGRR